MTTFKSAVYSLLKTVLQSTARRDYGREYSMQRRLRHWELPALQQYSRQQAVAYANRMAQLSSGFRRHLEAAGVTLPITADDESWQRLPFMTKAQIKADPQAWYTVPADTPGLCWTSTSGSTSEPFECPLDPPSLTAEVAAKELNLRSVGWEPGSKEAIIKRKEKPPTGFRRLALGMTGSIPVSFASRQLSPARVPEVVEELRRKKVKFLRGYPSALLLLADEMLKHGLTCRIPLIVALGEQLTPAAALLVERAFDGKVYRDYGASEAQHIAFECREQNGYHIDLARYHIELLNDGQPVRPGETGEIIITAFRNDAMPLVRYCIGDLATAFDPAERCPCGSPFPRLGEVLGRVVQVLHTGTGQQITEFFFHSFVLVINHASEHVARYKVLQKDKDTYEVLWVPRHAQARDHLPELERRILEKAQVPMTIAWREVEDIPPDPSGKRTQFVPLH